MLFFSKIEIENFGPFKNRQSIEFPQNQGVSIIYGENMRGKTILLNAIRYALFGKVLGRGAKEINLHQLSNWEKAEEGEFGFKIVVTMKLGEHGYELTRLCEPKNKQITPKANRDYREEVYLKRDSEVLGPTERDHELSKIMPEQVSRFFLFDGELLQEYEELLRVESEMGERIKRSIEKILGVPILKNSRADLRNQVKISDEKYSLAAKKDKETREIGQNISQLNEERKHHEKEIKGLKDELHKYNETKHSLQERLSEHEKGRYILKQQASLEKEKERIKNKINELKNETKEYMSNAWQGLLESKISKLQKTYHQELKELEEKRSAEVSEAEIRSLQEKAIIDNLCPLCMSRLNQKKVTHLENHLKESKPKDHDNGIKNKIQELYQKLSSLDRFDIENNSKVIAKNLHEIEKLEVELTSIVDQISEFKEQTRNFDQSEIRQLVSEKERLIKVISNAENALKEEEQNLNEVESNIKALQNRLKKLGGSSLDQEEQLSELCQDLYALFDQAVDEYRDQLREKVEKDASKLFLELTSEPDYSGLEINENYGLTIIHEDGRLIPIRSAGAEHVVALSLMGSLQKNAPLRGPIIMDSPFGRLDEEHTTKVTRALPKMAQQVILLVYESELKPKTARDSLKGKLLAEYTLERVTAKHTSIERMGME